MRSIFPIIQKDLESKMVFLSGPRQVGKTTMALELSRHFKGQYYNWDLGEDRQTILQKGFLNDGMVVLDELHKYEKWKSYLKGIYDKYHQKLKMMVTGSARLDVYKKGSDSLLGRYYHFHLHPLTVGELLNKNHIPLPEELLSGDHKKLAEAGDIFKALMKFGGFPEPFFKASETEHERWSLQRRELLVHEDIRDLTQITMLGLVEHLMLLLPERVGSVLSINALKEDLQVAYNTVAGWLDSFERLFICYRLKPYSKNLSRSLHKSTKLYLWDWSQIPNEANRFENCVASHLLKASTYWTDLGYGEYKLHYLRNANYQEVDFCLTKKGAPVVLIECKLADENVSEALIAFALKLGIPAFQLVLKEGVALKKGPVTVMSASRFLANLP